MVIVIIIWSKNLSDFQYAKGDEGNHGLIQQLEMYVELGSAHKRAPYFRVCLHWDWRLKEFQNELFYWAKEKC